MKFLYTAHITIVSWRFTILFKHECESQTTTLGTTSPTLANSVCGFFNVPQSNHEQGLRDGTYDLSSLSEKTR